MAEQSYEEDLLRQWFPTDAGDALKPFTESDIRGIADVLERSSRDVWSRIPRIYSILRKIGQLDAIDAFVDSGVTDVSFPFSKSTLPEALQNHSARLRFLELQHLVYNTEALDLERQARHGHFSDPYDVPLKKVGELGKGGFGYVDRVVSTISHKEYARKLILRGRTFRKDKQVLNAFTKELSNLKRLSHRHLVNLVGSYTDKKFVAIIMLPVADTNMQTFLEKNDLDDRARSLIRPFFGCLTSALCYLHDNRIRHKDIKPSNVLIKHDQVYLTDFGTSLDWSGNDNSTTATALPTTPRYCAPEVMSYVARNTSSDIWSLGCVFLEMWTVLRHHTLEDLRSHMSAHGTRVKEYHSNPDGFTGWIQTLERIPGPSCDHAPSTWISNMLQHQASSRWSCHILEDRIREISTDPTAGHAFSGLCCLEPDEDTTTDTGSFSESESGSDVRSNPVLEPNSAPEPAVEANMSYNHQHDELLSAEVNKDVRAVRAQEVTVPIPRVVISDYISPVKGIESTGFCEDEVTYSTQGEENAISSDGKSSKESWTGASSPLLPSKPSYTQPSHTWGGLPGGSLDRHPGLAFRDRDISSSGLRCRLCGMLLTSVADTLRLPCHHLIHKACFSRGYSYKFISSCTTCSIANQKPPKQANRGFVGPHHSMSTQQKRVDVPEPVGLEIRPITPEPIATRSKSKSTGPGRTLMDLLSGTKTTKPLQTKARTKSKRKPASDRKLRPPPPSGSRNKPERSNVASINYWGNWSTPKDTDEGTHMRPRKVPEDPVFEAYASVLSPDYRTQTDFDYKKSTSRRDREQIQSGSDDSRIGQKESAELDYDAPLMDAESIERGIRRAQRAHKHPRSGSVVAQSGYESPPPLPPQPKPSIARPSFQIDELKPYVKEEEYSTSGSEWDYIDTESERTSENTRSQTPTLTPENTRQRGRPAVSGPGDVNYGNERRRRSRNKLGDIRNRESDYDPNDVQYARKYGPEDIRWAPKSREDERRYVSISKPPYSRTATYVY